MSEMILRNKDEIENPRQRLARCPMVAKYGEEESGTLVHAFWDLEESFRSFLDEQLPKLADPSVEGEQLQDLLLDIEQEFRHILITFMIH